MEGIITTRPSTGALLLAGVAATLIALFGLVVAAYADTALSAIPAFVLVVGVASFLVDGLVAYLLVVHFFIFRQPVIGVVAAAYGFSACCAIEQVVAFPDVFFVGPQSGATAQSAIWIGVFWHTGFPLFILAAVAVQALWGERLVPKKRLALPMLASICVPLLLGAALNWFAIRYADLLPELIKGNDYGALLYGPMGGALWAGNALAVVALIALARLRSVFFLWLTVSVFSQFVNVALLLSTSTRYTLGWYAGFSGNLVSAVVLLAALLWEVHQIYPLLANANEELYWASVKDALTGLFNRRYFNTQLEAELARARRGGQPLALLLVDIDYFKVLNDRYGHQCGDHCLAAVAAVLKGHSQRPGDFAARYGGEEFALALVGTSSKGAAEVAELVRGEAERLRVQCASTAGTAATLTVSIGVASAERGITVSGEQLTAAADRALYQAKRTGRNRVCINELMPVAATRLPGVRPAA